MADLNSDLLAAAQKLVGKAAVTRTHFGRDCFVLVDMLLRQLGAKTAADGDVPITPTADYDWGDPIISPGPGDIIQFRKHVVVITKYKKLDNGTWFETEKRVLTRPHHTAVVVELRKDGSVLVIEQNVHPNADKVTRNEIPRLEPGEETLRNGDEKTVYKVTGEVHYYRPTPGDDKGASLSHPSTPTDRFATTTPRKGGIRRTPGTVGMDA